MRKHVMTLCGAAAAVLATVGGVSAQPKADAPTWTWGGDVRVRYDGQFRHKAAKDDQHRLRIRARLGAEGLLAEGKVKWGLGLATGTNNAVSRNVTLGGGDVNGAGGNIGIDKAYISFLPSDRLAITAGKMVNPFWTTDAIFDGDLTPEGLAVGYVFYPGSKGDLFTNVKSTTAFFAVREGGAFSNDPWMLGEQITTRAGGAVDLGLGFYYYSGLNAAGSGTPAAPTFIGTMSGGQAFNQVIGGKFVNDDMAVIDGHLKYAFDIKQFPLVFSGGVFGNVRESKHALGYEARFDFPKFLGSGAANLTFRNVDQNSTFSPWSDSDFGEGAGYRAGIRAAYSVPLYKAVTFTATAYHYERNQPTATTPVLAPVTNRLMFDVSASF